jgi:hypothetical protein
MNKQAAPKLATVAPKSENSKTGLMAATYTGYQTCPPTCKLKPVVHEDGTFDKSPCYACDHFVGMTMKRLTKASVNASPIQIQTQECNAIKKLSGELILRLKVGGDTPNGEYAEGLRDACEVYTAKHGMPAYGYTHNWANIERSSFGQISMLASCDSISDIPVAKSRGYATATLVSEFPNGAKTFTIAGEMLIPCPNQVNEKIQCVDCKLCTRDYVLRKKDLTVAFRAHGRKSEELTATLQEKGQ